MPPKQTRYCSAVGTAVRCPADATHSHSLLTQHLELAQLFPWNQEQKQQPLSYARPRIERSD